MFGFSKKKMDKIVEENMCEALRSLVISGTNVYWKLDDNEIKIITLNPDYKSDQTELVTLEKLAKWERVRLERQNRLIF